MRCHTKKDGNHNVLVAHFRAMGCSVAELVSTGIPGWPDTVVGVCGVDRLVELKNPETAYGRRGLNDNQTAFARDWRGGKVHTVSDIDQVTALVNSWRKGK